MKNLHFYLLLGCAGVAAWPGTADAQVADIGQAFTKRGYVQESLPEKKILLVNFIDGKSIYTEELQLDPPPAVKIDGRAGVVDGLRCGMEVSVTGEYFETKNFSVASKINATTRAGQSKSINDGRLDALSGDVAYADGHRIKLAPGKKITGEKRTGYKGKTFDSFSDLKLGLYMSVDGEYDADGYLLANRVTVKPETETERDKEAKSDNKEFWDKFRKSWDNPQTQASRYGRQLGDEGRVVNNPALQAYVNRVGQQLVPPHIRNKLAFSFVVTDKRGKNANMQPNGVCIVHRGLLYDVQNEAQLAAVLGHEITHAIYEHGASQISDEETNRRTKKLLVGAGSKAKDVLEQFGAKLTVNEQSKTIDAATTDLLIKDLPEVSLAKTLSTHSIDDELQADRVGLALMVQAGYDPREALIIWKNAFNERAAVPVEKTTKAYNGPDPFKARGEAADIGLAYLTAGVTRMVDLQEERNLQTHPKDLQRFEELNRLIGLYYSDPAFLNSTKTGAAEYVATVGKFRKEYAAYLKKAKEDEKKAAAQRVQWDKQLPGAMAKAEGRLKTLKPLYTYKEYKIWPVANIRQLAGNPKCGSAELDEQLAAAQDLLDQIGATVARNAAKLKAGQIEPHEKDVYFAVTNLTAKRLNEIAVAIAGPASLCDRETAVKAIPTAEAMNGAVQGVAASPDLNKILEFLKEK